MMTTALPPQVPMPIGAPISLPPGNYVIQAKGQLNATGEGGAVEIDCQLMGTVNGQIDAQRVVAVGLDFTTTALLGTLTTTGEDVWLQCNDQDAVVPAEVDNAQLVAVQVGDVNSSTGP
ncbi:MAG TPA: hypothetical protein VLW85_15875 [Myxococcales bacterium]|nr:hypothetical protein [Myxococcales bacterium]